MPELAHKSTKSLMYYHSQLLLKFRFARPSNVYFVTCCVVGVFHLKKKDDKKKWHDHEHRQFKHSDLLQPTI